MYLTYPITCVIIITEQQRGGDKMALSTGGRVAAARSEKGLSQKALADACNVSQVCIARVESGTLTPSLAIALAIAKALGTTVDALFG